MGPMTRCVGPETLVDVLLEGYARSSALADCGSQVNTMILEFIQEWGYPVLPLDGLINYPLHLVGLGGRHAHVHWDLLLQGCRSKKWQVMTRMLYFWWCPDESAFGKRVPLVIGTCTLAWVINVIKENEMDKISTPWVTVHLMHSCCHDVS